VTCALPRNGREPFGKKSHCPAGVGWEGCRREGKPEDLPESADHPLKVKALEEWGTVRDKGWIENGIL